MSPQCCGAAQYDVAHGLCLLWANRVETSVLFAMEAKDMGDLRLHGGAYGLVGSSGQCNRSQGL
jgi:hypothetical protein